jgi:hypothetical protein
VAGLCLFSLGFGASLSAQGSGQTTIKLSRLYGIVMHEKKTGQNRVAKSVKYADFPVNDVAVSVFSRTSSECCQGDSPVAELRTKKNGRFEFAKVSSGNYRVVAVVDGKTFKTPIEYARSKDQPGDCNQLLFTMDKNGNLILKAMITVD